MKGDKGSEVADVCVVEFHEDYIEYHNSVGCGTLCNLLCNLDYIEYHSQHCCGTNSQPADEGNEERLGLTRV